MKIYVLLWKYNHRGEFDSGFIICNDKAEALGNLSSCYKQAIHNITPCGTHDELNIDDYSEKQMCYYVERYAADSWESGEVFEEEL